MVKCRTWERWSLTGTCIRLIEINRIYLTDNITKRKELSLSTKSEIIPLSHFRLACTGAGQRPALPGENIFLIL
ncbi:hypothetical protein J7L05_08735, partial [bacterium]|nr:hypothetical protein [bacterium]